MITSILTVVVIGCLFYEVLPKGVLVFLCAAMGVFLGIVSHHKSEGYFSIDVLAQRSKINQVNPTIKFWTVLTLLFLCVASNSSVVGLVLLALMLILTVFIGGLKLHDYFSLLSIPMSFILISALALLFDFRPLPNGVINVPLIYGYLSITKEAQMETVLVIFKALGAISCLYFLSLSTTITEIIGVLRRSHVPDIIIELMYLIYRYTFILLEIHRSMRDAAKSRLGFINFTTSLHTTGNIYSNLLMRSYQQANKNFDAMESRCYTGEIRFLENKKNVSYVHILFAIGFIILIIGLIITFP